jgi:hypothetical protein
MFGERIYKTEMPEAEEDILAKQISPTGAEEAGIFFPRRNSQSRENAYEGTIAGKQEDERMRTMQELLNMANDKDD